MKKYFYILFVFAGILFSAQNASAQKYAFVDMEYIMGNIPAYEAAQEQLNQLSKGWEEEIQSIYAEVEQLYKNYQKESVFLSAEMKTQRENDILDLERQAKQLQRKYFGPEGELMLRQQELIEPIQERVSNAIAEIATQDNLDAVFDLAGNISVVYLKPSQNISEKVLQHMGFTD